MTCSIDKEGRRGEDEQEQKDKQNNNLLFSINNM